ncbi:autotransporter domain-containing protein [uncultured Selenomonas sp.]|uniref:autotransporter domain-containing protein n=1 Tax=uncultured Selenomonas sp. TaxID=159275 RepID=UPI0028ED08AC|nr:autotransporter domain-containing protein [uncultured Selenomonas sp.]
MGSRSASALRASCVLAKGDTISLLKIAAGHTLTTDADLRNDVTGMQGVSMRYRFGLEKQGNDELIATVRDTEINPQTKSLVETRVAAAALINDGADLLAEGGMNAAVHAASADKLRSALGVKNGDFALWAAQSGSALRLNSGSHIDAKGWNLNLGFARQKTAAHNTLTYGPFIEYGRGSYDSYLDDGTHGDGTVSYVGAGVMAKAKTSGGSYIEGSVRVGRAKSDDTSNIAGQRTGYDMSSTYYGAHIGVGQEKQTAGGTLDTYAKYFYTHQSGGSERLTTGETYDFDDVDSSRLRIGTRWTKKTLAGEFYTGLAYEYEFGSDARASYAGYGTPTPTLKGSTGLFELGYRFVRTDSNVSYGVNLTGMMGKRRGITGSMQVNWAL